MQQTYQYPRHSSRRRAYIYNVVRTALATRNQGSNPRRMLTVGTRRLSCIQLRESCERDAVWEKAAPCSRSSCPSVAAPVGSPKLTAFQAVGDLEIGRKTNETVSPFPRWDGSSDGQSSPVQIPCTGCSLAPFTDETCFQKRGCRLARHDPGILSSHDAGATLRLQRCPPLRCSGLDPERVVPVEAHDDGTMLLGSRSKLFSKGLSCCPGSCPFGTPTLRS